MSHRLILTSAFLVVVNLLPMAGVLFFGWSVYEIVLLFWAENLVVGMYAMARMVTLYRRNGDRRNLLLIPFFCFHFGMFTLVHLVFVISMFRPEDHVSGGTGMSLWIPFLALLISHGASYVMNFIGKREYRGMDGEEVMMAPYKRVVILHVTILVGGFLVSALGQPAIALALLVGLKIFIDVVAHAREHRSKETAEEAKRKTGRADGDVFRPWD
ncbi:hypothetical protein IC757_03205 [Wenzhouxiangella sp. AB-CW3]|uniref:DUF6498-containing protein n=1 Tax=Wenzhouxiangella sp. AB-CW3 TaxID=2771012 RepID=UPI00168B07CF|nr:DUF6498-containing protein [Wenzhouxiangella sp. AB-CW3]QOC23179.1 hypothetical protein IC757_03205 [Wenzhouxiangella sp. AB-CW3]